MRLSPNEINSITSLFRKHFSAEDHWWIFGSRIDDNKRGGDIDLYVETIYDAEKSVHCKIAYISDLWIAIGEQKIDVVLKLIHSDFDLAIYYVAKDEGIQLVWEKTF